MGASRAPPSSPAILTVLGRARRATLRCAERRRLHQGARLDGVGPRLRHAGSTIALSAADLDDVDGAFMEPRGCNQWQLLANRLAAGGVKTSNNRCRGLRPVA